MMTLSNSISHSVSSWFSSMRKMLWNSFIFRSTKKFSKLIMLCYGFREIIRIIKTFKITINCKQNLGWLVGLPSLPVKGSSIWFPSTWLLCVWWAGGSGWSLLPQHLQCHSLLGIVWCCPIDSSPQFS